MKLSNKSASYEMQILPGGYKNQFDDHNTWNLLLEIQGEFGNEDRKNQTK